MLEAPDDLVRSEAFNVGSDDQNYLVRDLAQVVGDVTGCDIEFASDASPDPRSYRVDFSKLARAFPELRLEWDSRRGSEELVSAYRSVPLTAELFDGRRYVRLRQLRHLLNVGELGDELRWSSGVSARATHARRA